MRWSSIWPEFDRNDRGLKSSDWLEMNESGEELKVRSYLRKVGDLT